MRSCLLISALLTSSMLLIGCSEQAADGPPIVRLGDSVCDQCNMIISDQRWATATVVAGPRGPEARLFDDFNCQVNYEIEHPDAEILARWSHSHATHDWIQTEGSHFLMSPNLRTPMGSKAAAFGSASDAEAAKAQLDGDVMTFKVAWSRLGFAGACCDADHSEQTDPQKESFDGP